MRGIQVLIALAALIVAPIVGLVAPVFAVFAGTSGIAGLGAASWHKSVAISVVFTALQIAALAGSVWIVLQPMNSDAQPTIPSAQIQPGAGSIPASDRAAP
ncbi:MAG: hypothetical protein GC190_20740 [Alphaproteobacteria bacterium]|nr:hypothetical protein [Alphaproteobacteria bacterium]